MSTFPLAELAPILLEKVFAKCDALSYCRLQRTCRDMKEFVQKSSKLRIPFVVEAYFVFKNEGLFFENGRHCGKYYPIRALHGIRLDSFKSDYIRNENEEKFKLVCDALVKHHITAREVLIVNAKMTTTQWQILFDILKPVKLYFNRGDLFETVLQLKTLDTVTMCTYSENPTIHASKLFSAFPRVKLTVPKWELAEPIYHTILEILQCTAFSASRSFHYSLFGPLPSQVELQEEFPYFNWAEDGNKQISAMVELPDRFPDGSTCEIVFNKRVWLQMHVYYKKGDVLPAD